MSLPTSDSSAAQVLVGHRVGELLEQLALLARQPARDDDVDDDAQVAAAAGAPQHAACPWPRSAIVSPGCVPGGDVDVRRRRRASAPSSVAPERGERRGDVEHGDEVVAVAHEALVRGDAHEDVEVAGRARRARRRGRGR